MVKVKGPLLSMEAVGSIGPRLTFSKRQSGQQVRYQKAQSDVITSGRDTQRGYFSAAYAAWNGLSDNDQQEWNDFIN